MLRNCRLKLYDATVTLLSFHGEQDSAVTTASSRSGHTLSAAPQQREITF